jgi:hypothetical protein
MGLYLEVIDIKEFLDEFGADQNMDRQSSLREMLTDLRHIAKEWGLDFDHANKESEEDFSRMSDPVCGACGEPESSHGPNGECTDF